MYLFDLPRFACCMMQRKSEQRYGQTARRVVRSHWLTAPPFAVADTVKSCTEAYNTSTIAYTSLSTSKRLPYTTLARFLHFASTFGDGHAFNLGTLFLGGQYGLGSAESITCASRKANRRRT